MSNLTIKDFEVSEFNVLRGNVSDSRESRDKTVVNTDEGLSRDTRVLSQAQDSNYSLESWTRGRYTGTEQTYLIGNNPSVSLTPIRIAIFSKETENKAIRDKLNSGARSPKFETGYFTTYIREIPVKSVPTPEFGTITRTLDSIKINVNNNNSTGEQVSTEIRDINGEWIKIGTFSGNVSNIEANYTQLPSGTEFTFQIRNTMLIPGYNLMSETVTKTATTRIKIVTATFNTSGGTFIPSITGPVPLTVSTPKQPVRPGFEFTGWEPSIPTTITENTTFNVKWTPLPGNPGDIGNPDCLYITNFGAGLDPCLGGFEDTFLTAGVTLSALADQNYHVTLRVTLAPPGINCSTSGLPTEDLTITISSGSQFGEIDCFDAQQYEEGTKICNVEITQTAPSLPLTNPCLNLNPGGNGEGSPDPNENGNGSNPQVNND